MVGRYRSLRSIKTRDVSTGVFHTDRVYTLHKLYKSKLDQVNWIYPTLR